MINPADTIFRELEGSPIRWRDRHGTIHAVEGSEVHEGIVLLWTLCGVDVPGGDAFSLAEVGVDGLDCAVCKSRIALPPQPPDRT